MTEQATSDIKAALKSIWLSGKYSDMTIRCEEHTFKVHRNIVCPRSSFFERAIDGKFKEAELKHVDLEEQELSIINAVLEYLYTGDYNDEPTANKENDFSSFPPESETPKAETTPEVISQVVYSFYNPHGPFNSNIDPPASLHASTLVFNTKVYIAADYFDIPALKVFASSKYLERASGIGNWNCPEFSEAADLLWNEIPEDDRQLRNIVISTAGTNARALLDSEDFLALTSKNGSFALDVLKFHYGVPLGGALEDGTLMTKRTKRGSKKGKIRAA